MKDTGTNWHRETCFQTGSASVSKWSSASKVCPSPTAADAAEVAKNIPIRLICLSETQQARQSRRVRGRGRKLC